MRKHPNLALAVLFALAMAVGGFQGHRLRHVRESELFYRWMLAEAVQARVFTAETDTPTEPNVPKMMDRELFNEILDVTDPVLPEQGGVDEQGKPFKKLVLLARDESQDPVIWDLARSDRLAPQREEFLHYLREKRLSSVASEFDPNAVYSGEGANVGISNIFFGFRKLAANFVWLQVDKYWHQGMMHRMLPLMKTCVALDPNFIDAYLVGAWHLAYNATAKMADTPEPLKKYSPEYGVRIGEKELYFYLAIDFLKDGIRKNPRNYKLYFDLGFAVYKEKMKDYPNAVRYLSEAIRYRHDRWVPRQLYICLELNHQFEEAEAGWEDYLKNNPDNPTEIEKANRFIARNKGQIYERDAEQLVARAQNDSDRAEAVRLRAEAMKIWENMKMGSGGEIESFALGRIMRTRAVKLIEEQRYLEAIALLQNAWTKSNAFADEALRMIIDTKIKAGLPLSVSEKKAVMRREEAEKYKTQGN